MLRRLGVGLVGPSIGVQQAEAGRSNAVLTFRLAR